MNYVIVRTKLQALIVLELLRSGIIRKPFGFVPLYQHRVGEDGDSLGVCYSAIAAQAKFVIPILQASGLLKNGARLVVCAIRSLLTHGSIYAAVVNYYGLAVALRLVPGVRFCSFDDGTANIDIRDTSYHSTKPLSPGTLKRWLARRLFPLGASAFCRGRIATHYTIYPGLRNIVNPEKVVPIRIDWSQLLSAAEKARIRRPVRSIVIGSVYREFGSLFWRARLDWALARADLYLPHPRQKDSVYNTGKMLVLDATAEGLISYLLQQGAEEITLYHFNSSVVLSFSGDPRVRCVDLLDSAFAGLDENESAYRDAPVVPA